MISGQIILASSNRTHIWVILRKIEIQYPLLGPYYILVQYSRELLNNHCFKEGSQSRTKILGGITRMKFWDRENQKVVTGFRDMADFFKENQDPIPPLVGPFICIYIKSLVKLYCTTRLGSKGRTIKYKPKLKSTTLLVTVLQNCFFFQICT